MGIVRKFFNSNYFIVLTYTLTILFWTLQAQELAMLYYAISGVLIIAVDAKRINIVTIVMAAIINHRITRYQENLHVIIPMTIVVVVIFLYDIYKNKITFKNEILIAMFIFLGANILSLININSNTLHLGINGVLQILAMCIVFIYFFNKKEEHDYKYIAKNAAFLGIAIAIEFTFYIITYDGDMLGKNIRLGWGISNSIAMTVLMLIPLTYYLYIENQNRSYILLVGKLEIIVVILMLSKGAYLSLVLVIVPFYIFIYFIIKERKRYLLDLFYSFSIFIVLIVFLTRFDLIREGIIQYFDGIDNRGGWFQDPSRIDIYQTGIDVFKRFPLFGSGSYTSVYYLVEYGHSERLKHYHNYIVQTLATLGIVGMFAFGYYLYSIFKNTLVKNPFNNCVLFALLAILVHGLVDNTWYNPIAMVIITLYLSLMNNTEKGLVVN